MEKNIRLIEVLDNIPEKRVVIVKDQMNHFIAIIYIDEQRSYRRTLSSYFCNSIIKDWKESKFNLHNAEEEHKIKCIVVHMLGICYN